MTVSSSVNKVIYSGNSATVLFPVNYYFLENSHLKVILRAADGTETVQTLTTNYTVTGAGNPAGGSITMLVAPVTGTTLTIVRNVPATQETDYLANDPFPAESHERALDKLTMLTQENEEIASRSIQIPQTDPVSTNIIVPKVSDRASRLLGFGAAGSVAVSGSTIAQVDAAVATINTIASAPSGNSAGISHIASGIGATPTTVQTKLRENVSVKDFGAVGDGVTDDYAAIMAAINSFTTGTGFYVSGPAVYFPPGTYYCSQTIELKKSVRLYGDHSGLQSTSMATLLFPPGVTGIIVQRYNTIGNGVESPATTAGDASIIERLQIRGQFGTADSAGGHGIWLRARAALRQLTVSNFTGNGVHIVASSAGAPSVLGNANTFVLDSLVLLRNGGWGAFIDGSDVNAGVAKAVNVNANGLGGLYDSSFLGNTHIAHHAAANGAASSGYNTTLGKTSLVSFGGNRYYGANNATEASLVATTPGTDEAVWALSGAGNPNFSHLLWVAGQPEGTYFSSAQYKSDSANARNIFIGCYAEGGYSPSFFVRPTLILGGSIDARGGAYLTSTLSATVVPGIFETETIELGFEADRSTGNFISFPDTSNGVGVWTLEKIVGRVGWSYRNLATPGFVSLYDQTATIANGYARDLNTFNGALGIGAHYFGSSTQMKFRGLASAIPTTGTYLQGDILYDLTPTASGFIGWVCTTAGTPGTWKTFGAISA